MVALLVTFSWKREGQVFPVFEGRNYIGRDAECEVCLAHDAQLSSKHMSLIYRGKDFWIDDLGTMNGTFLNGEPVEEKQKVGNYSTIRSGATEWTFITVEPKAAPGTTRAPSGE